MKTYKIISTITVEVATLVKASNMKEAKEIALEKLDNGDVNICVHGSEHLDGLNTENFVLVDGSILEHGNIKDCYKT